MDNISKWCKTWGFKISNAKSTAVIFTRRRKVPPVTLKINDACISIKKEFKYLGIIFDSRLSYNSHSKYVAKKCQSRLNFMRLLSGVTWGADTRVLLVIYRVLIRPIIDYGFEVYLSSHQYVLKRMQIIQNSALRICCGAMKSSPICALQHFCNKHSITIRRLHTCLLYRCHAISIPNHPCRTRLDHTGKNASRILLHFALSTCLLALSDIVTLKLLPSICCPNPHGLIKIFELMSH